MSFNLWQAVVIFATGFVAGMMNSVAGGGTLLTFPALIWMGMDAKAANITSTVALWPGSLGGMFGFRRELRDARRWMRLLALPSVLGGLVGAVLLLQTPARIFAAIVPFLILFATILFAAGEKIARRIGSTAAETSNDEAATGPRRAWRIFAVGLQLISAIYGGYFGAGNGIIILAVLSLMGLTDIHQMNGLKNFIAVCINVVASAYFMLWGDVHWAAALVMMVGAIAGGYGGAGLARRMGRRFARIVVIVIGLAMAVSLLFRR